MSGFTGTWRSVLAAAVLAAGCAPDTRKMDDRDRSEPLVGEAQVRLDRGDSAGAIRAYEAALDANPRLARAHLDLALLLHDHEKDYVGAIYHYRRYLDLRKDTKKQALIEDRIRLAGQLYAGQVLRQEVALKAAEEASAKKLAAVEAENAALKAEVAELSSAAAARERGSVAASPAPEPAPRADAVDAAPSSEPVFPTGTGDVSRVTRTYRVRSGDSLNSIAEDVYGRADRWSAIYELNRATVPNPNKLKTGQVLVLP